MFQDVILICSIMTTWLQPLVTQKQKALLQVTIHQGFYLSGGGEEQIIDSLALLILTALSFYSFKYSF